MVEKFEYQAEIQCRILSMYDIKDEDIDIVTDLSQFSTPTQQSPLQMQLPVLELLKVCVLLFCLFVSWHYRLNFKAAVA